ncbi:Lipocalin-like domain-containing protein [Tenacibaculum sp. MAR_2009_124]|uniref:DUF5004 domain-containing protein n=1 Tax=Tenacibaculum sp. MAR_2009_124 TaxID=1250059 RepID=UPI000894C0BA|nr:DUF5004 domain-containing protein [Tenacibaculum sp. MAR_2009_124]SEC18834.1 Lipocalin-like domain-containing protein [Tenacibaculum sp. MAR_2009_124]
MKNLTLLLLLTSLLISCSESIDNYVSPDPIHGHWQLSQIIINNRDVTNTCFTKATVNFNSDKTLSSEFYGSVRGSCTSAGAKNGTWKNENNTYSIDFNEDFQQTVTAVSFLDNYTKLSITIEVGTNTVVVYTFTKI